MQMRRSRLSCRYLNDFNLVSNDAFTGGILKVVKATEADYHLLT